MTAYHPTDVRINGDLLRAAGESPTRSFHLQIITSTGAHVDTNTIGADVYNMIAAIQLQYPGCTIIIAE